MLIGQHNNNLLAQFVVKEMQGEIVESQDEIQKQVKVLQDVVKVDYSLPM